jgi:hypothetical protein
MAGELTVDGKYRQDLPPIPDRMLWLPVTRGYPTPWFVAQVPGEAIPCPDGKEGCEVLHRAVKYDLRIADGEKRERAVRERLCWVCGQALGVNLAFILGPMCTITRTTSEPPAHKECAEFSAKACPFLTQQESGYRDGGLPDGISPSQAPGCPILRQPGVSAIWMARRFDKFGDGKGGWLIRVGDPDRVTWWSHGRLAFIKEVHESIRTGFPRLFEMAAGESLEAVLELNEQLARAMEYANKQDWKA